MGTESGPGPSCGHGVRARSVLWACSPGQVRPVGMQSRTGPSCGHGVRARSVLWACSPGQVRPVGTESGPGPSCGHGVRATVAAAVAETDGRRAEENHAACFTQHQRVQTPHQAGRGLGWRACVGWVGGWGACVGGFVWVGSVCVCVCVGGGGGSVGVRLSLVISATLCWRLVPVAAKLLRSRGLNPGYSVIQVVPPPPPPLPGKTTNTSMFPSFTCCTILKHDTASYRGLSRQH